MPETYNGLIGLGREIIRKSRLSNAMGIPLVFVVIIFLGGLVGFIVTRDPIFFWVMIIPIVFFITSFVYMMIFKPKLLRTEEHEERMLQLASGMGQKGEELSETSVYDLPSIPPDATQLNGSPRKEIER